jgi:hypothetical protein
VVVFIAADRLAADPVEMAKPVDTTSHQH